MEKSLILLRGCPGSGKTTITKILFPNAKAFAADDYMVDGSGNYDFRPEKLGYAHKLCVKGVEEAMQMSHAHVVVHNTLTTEKELMPYLELAKKYDYNIFSFIVENRHGNSNVHSVPEAKLLEMAERLKNSIKLLP